MAKRRDRMDVGEPRWDEKSKRWIVTKQLDGKRKFFYSSQTGRVGKAECRNQALDWCRTGIDGRAMRCCDSIDRYVEGKKLTVGTNRYRNIKLIMDQKVKPILRTVTFDRLTEGMLQEVLDKAYADGAKKGYLQTIRAVMKTWLVSCQRDNLTGITGKNLTIAPNARYIAKKALGLEHIETLFSVDTTLFRGNRIYCSDINYFRFGMAFGMRPGERRGLREQDITTNGSRWYIKIEGAINSIGEQTMGKNADALRTIELPPLAIKILKDQAAYKKKMRIISPLVFCGRDGKPIPYTTLAMRWKAYQLANGIDPVITLYELRNSFVANGKRHGLDLDTLKSVVGHSQGMDTLGTYDVAMAGDEGEQARALQAMFDNVLGDKADAFLKSAPSF